MSFNFNRPSTFLKNPRDNKENISNNNGHDYDYNTSRNNKMSSLAAFKRERGQLDYSVSERESERERPFHGSTIVIAPVAVIQQWVCVYVYMYICMYVEWRVIRAIFRDLIRGISQGPQAY